jgi:8-oxo-dGTP diphosphatase
MLLLVVAILLLYTILPVISIYAILKFILHRDPRRLKLWFYSTARAIDILGNVISANLFNDIFIKKSGYKFGRRGETISSVLGKNQKLNTLNTGGRVLRNMLDLIEQDHCVKSILSDEDINNRK